jgi:DnaJ family protein C protein 2
VERQEKERAEEELKAKKAKAAEARERERLRGALLRWLKEHQEAIGGDMVTKAEAIEAHAKERFAALVAEIEMGGSDDKGIAVVKRELAEIEEKAKRRAETEAEEERARKERAAAAAAAKAARAPWSEAELSLLARAVRKYPPGVHDRWEKMAALVVTRTPDEIIEKTLEIKRSRDATHAVAASRDDPFERLKQHATTRPIDSPLDIAWDRLNEPGATTTTATAQQAKKPAAPAAMVWSAEQQKQLEEGLRTHKKAGKDRWELIAAMVPGKTAADCKARFDFLKEALSKAQPKK